MHYPGDTLSNDGGGAVLEDFELKDMSETVLQKEQYQVHKHLILVQVPIKTLTTSGSVTIASSNFPSPAK